MLVNISDKKISEKVGNKAKFLMVMKSNGFQVPDGFILDIDTFNEIISYNKKQEQLTKILSNINESNIKRISEEIFRLFDDFIIPEDIVKEIIIKLKKGTKYAVRSSGLKEDLEKFSFAGQYSTFLKVDGVCEIKNAIIKCYKSMYTEGVLSYFINNEIDVNNLEMAVIVEEMVNSEKSGITFTVNPVTGIDKEIVVEVAKGLGELIVSGQVVPERYIYNWFEDTYYYSKDNQLLNQKELKELMETALNIQMYFGYPCDIEFAIEKDKIYILQARAITKIMYSKIEDQWSTANFKDGGVSSTVCTPYMWSLYEYIWETTLKKFMLDSNILKEKELHKLGDMFYGRPYWNMSVVKNAMSKVPGYKEREFDREFGVKITYEGNGNTTKITPKSIIRTIKIAFAQKRILRERNDNTQIYKKYLLEKYSDYTNDYSTEYSLIDFETIWSNLIKKDHLESQETYFWQIFINTIHQILFKNKLLKYVKNNDYLNLLGGLDNISHLLPFYDMWDISREIITDKCSYEFWNQSTVLEIQNEYDKNSREYCIPEFKDYVNRYGYHSEKELDVTYPCYFENIDSLIKMFKDTIVLDEKYSPNTDKERQSSHYYNQLDVIKNQVSKKKYEKLLKNIEDMRSMLWWREEFRDISTRFYYIIRIYTLKLAELYKEKGILDNVDDIWYLKISDIKAFIDKKKTKSDINKIILQNKKYYNSFRNFTSENEIGSIFDNSDVAKKDNSSSIVGIGCNNGVVTGIARVIESLDEIDNLKVDDILITKFTDTGCTSKFAILKGIVTEYGGVLCHAAIISREYGIPCIVCTHNATKLIKDGSIISINGTTGEIIIIKE